MSQSKAAHLQNIALFIASKRDEGLDLIKTPSSQAIFNTLPEGSVHPGDRVLLVGATEGPIAELLTRRAGANGKVLVIESEQQLLDRLRQVDGAVESDPSECASLQLQQAALDDFRTNPAFLATYLADHPVTDLTTYRTFQQALEIQRAQEPLVASESADVVVVNQALHRLVEPHVKQLLAESLRILRPGGRLVVLVLLADEAVPAGPIHLGQNELHYVPRETEIADMLGELGCYGMRYSWRAELPAKVVGGVELRAFVVEAFKDTRRPALDRGHAVLYRGPWREVVDDDGRRYVRGERTAVSEQTYQRLSQAPYQSECVGIPCYLEIIAEQAPPFDADTPAVRDPQVTKGKKTVFETRSNSCC